MWTCKDCWGEVKTEVRICLEYKVELYIDKESEAIEEAIEELKESTTDSLMNGSIKKMRYWNECEKCGLDCMGDIEKIAFWKNDDPDFDKYDDLGV